MTILQNIMCKCAKSFSTGVPRSPTGVLPLDPTGGLPSPEPRDWPVFILGLSGGIHAPPQKKKNSEIRPKIRQDRRTRGTNLWLEDIDKNFGPGLPLLFKLHEICQFGQLILRKIIKIVATRCQILRLKCTKFDFGWSSPQTPLGSLQRSPDPLAGFKGTYF